MISKELGQARIFSGGTDLPILQRFSAFGVFSFAGRPRKEEGSAGFFDCQSPSERILLPIGHFWSQNKKGRSGWD